MDAKHINFCTFSIYFFIINLWLEKRWGVGGQYTVNYVQIILSLSCHVCWVKNTLGTYTVVAKDMVKKRTKLHKSCIKGIFFRVGGNYCPSGYFCFNIFVLSLAIPAKTMYLYSLIDSRGSTHFKFGKGLGK